MSPSSKRGPPASPQAAVLNFSWREYGNRVGAWRCLELFDSLGLPAAALINTALYDHCPELVAACVARGDELVGHGHTNAERQAALDEAGARDRGDVWMTTPGAIFRHAVQASKLPA